MAHSLKTWKIPTSGRAAKGVPLPQVLPISSEEDDEVAGIISVAADSFEDDDAFLCLVTKKGWIKKTPLKAFEKTSSRGLVAIGALEDGDRVSWVKTCDSTDSIIVATKKGYATHFKTDRANLRPTGRTSRGVKTMNLRDDDVIVDMDILKGLGAHAEAAEAEAGGAEEAGEADTDADGDEGLDGAAGNLPKVLIVTTNGYGKRSTVKDFTMRKRGGMGVIATKFKDPATDELACLRVVDDDDEIMISTSSGVMVRQRAGGIPSQGRLARGVVVQKLDAGSYINDVSIVPNQVVPEEGEGGSNGLNGGGAAANNATAPVAVAA